MKKTACAAARAFSLHRVVAGIVLHMFQHVANWKHMNRLAQSIKRMIQTDRETQNQTELPDQISAQDAARPLFQAAKCRPKAVSKSCGAPAG